MLLRDRVLLKYLVFLAVLPVLSIVSVLTLNVSGNNLLTCATIVIVIVTIAVFFFKSSQLSTLYPLALFVIGVSLLLGASLANTSYHIHGYDMFGEYNVYQLTIKNGNWSLAQFPPSNPPSTDGLNAYSSCLSITILPAMISLVTGYNGEMIFLLLYPIILALSLPVIYHVLRKRIGAQTAFLSTLLMLNFTYVLEISTLPTQEIALFLFSLAIFVMFSERGSEVTRYLMLLLISFGIITSHYATGYTYLAVLLVLALAGLLFCESAKRRAQVRINVLAFLLVFCLAFSWYMVLTLSPFTQIVIRITSTMHGLQDFFTAPRNLAPIGVSSSTQVGYTLMQDAVSYAIQFFLLVGTLSYALRSRKVNKQESSVEKHIIFLALCIFAALAIFTLLPTVSLTYGTNRLYCTLLPFLLFFFAEGVSWIFRNLGVQSKRPIGIIMVTLVVLQILISSGLMSLAFSYPLPQIASFSETVRIEGPSVLQHYVFDDEVSGNRWFSQYYNKNETVFADEYEILRLWSYGGVVVAKTLTGDELQLQGQNGYVLLRYENVVYNTIDGSAVTQKNITQLSASLSSSADRLYDNGGALVYQISYHK